MSKFTYLNHYININIKVLRNHMFFLKKITKDFNIFNY